MTTKTARRVMGDLKAWSGDAAIYQLFPPYQYEDEWDDLPTTHEVRWVVVSATTTMFTGPETYIFRTSPTGDVLDWGELPGSFQGALDHARALSGLGYEVAS